MLTLSEILNRISTAWNILFGEYSMLVLIICVLVLIIKILVALIRNIYADYKKDKYIIELEKENESLKSLNKAS